MKVLFTKLEVTYAIALVATFCGNAGAVENKSSIPLGTVWALNMPGTLELTDAMRRDGYISSDGPVVRRIRAALMYDRQQETAGQGFVVVGDKAEALRQCLKKMETPDEDDTGSIHGDETLWIVFFAHESGAYVHLDSVDVVNSKITVNYRFVPHRTKETTSHFALIPVGDLPSGEYEVEMMRLPLSDDEAHASLPEVDKEWDERLISRPFEFVINDRRSLEKKH